MIECLAKVEVKGYNKKHMFRIEKTSVSGHVFIRLFKNNTLVLNCTEEEFKKFQGMFS